MADEDAIQRKRERLTAETNEYYWNVCPELTARWKQAMFTLPPSVLRDLAVEIQRLENVTNAANQQLHAALGAGGEPAEDLLDRALASMEHLSEAADTMTRLLGELLKSA
jgi:DNA polymerase III delta prime subunit